MFSEAGGGGAQRPAPGEVDSILEVFSATTGRWYPARIVQALPAQPGAEGQEVLTVQFYVDDEAKQKSMYRGDQHLAALGTHLGGELPPGFEIKPSQSRPGQLVYLDATTGMKYASPELAWRLHFDRMAQRPPEGVRTVCAMPPPGGP